MSSHRGSDAASRCQKTDKPLILAEFRASWCPACSEQSRVVEQLEREFPGRLDRQEIDIEKHPARAIEAGVLSVPTLILYERGEEVTRFIGFHDRNDICAFLRKRLLIEICESHHAKKGDSS
jgi:thioredoxin 1